MLARLAADLTATDRILPPSPRLVRSVRARQVRPGLWLAVRRLRTRNMAARDISPDREDSGDRTQILSLTTPETPLLLLRLLFLPGGITLITLALLLFALVLALLLEALLMLAKVLGQ